MDKDLYAIMEQGGENTSLSFDDPEAGVIVIQLPDGPRPYTLKPLEQLYEAKPPIESLDMKDETYQPLTMAIDGEIAQWYRRSPKLTDGQVLLALKPLAMNPAASSGTDSLGQTIQMALRLCLSLNAYSQQEVKLAIRKVLQSVQRHNRLGGSQGYVSFIVDYC